MMKFPLLRIAVAAAVVAAIASCDTRPTTAITLGTSGTTTPAGGKNTVRPTVSIDTPAVGALVNVGDSILVSLRLHDNQALTNASVTGLTLKGSANLGTLTQTVRYTTILIPGTGTFRPGLRDTVIRRYLKPVVPVDSSLDSLLIFAQVLDSAGLTDSVSRRVNIVSGPSVSVLTPSPGDSVPAGVAMTVSVRATHPDGVGRISVRIQGEAIWPTRLDTTLSQTYTGATRDVTFTTTIRIPADATLRSRVTITASAIDVNRQPGSAPPVIVFVRASGVSAPRVTQVVPPRSEASDSVTITATGDGITFVGFIVRDSAGTLIKRDSVALPSPFTSNVQRRLPLNLSTALQGKRVSIVSFAIDQAGRTGYSIKAGTQVPASSEAAAFADSTLIVYGHTFSLPRNGVIGDLAVDPVLGNVFLSNTNFNLLEVWQNGTKQFAPNGIAVGSLPWGLFVSNSPDTLLVANSGATTISRVFIGSAVPALLHENLPQRIRTRNSFFFVTTYTVDATTRQGKFTDPVMFSFSDRPQYIAQSRAGRIFYSTRPTANAPVGTVDWLDPTLPIPQPRQVWQYASPKATAAGATEYVLFNVDTVFVGHAGPGSLSSDILYIFDHPYGQAGPTFVVADSLFHAAVVKDVAAGGRPDSAVNIDVTTLALRDTSFVAASGDRNWIGFGEGNTTTPGRIIMVNDPPGPAPLYFSSAVAVQDLLDNASEKVFGLAIDSVGRQVGSHGANSYFAAIDNPFHLRLEGSYNSLDNGAGIAFHPGAFGPNTLPSTDRLAFVASTTGTIEVVDIAYFINRATLLTKATLYGPLRATRRLPGDPANVVVKLFGLTVNGLVVIDLTAADIRAGP